MCLFICFTVHRFAILFRMSISVPAGIDTIPLYLKQLKLCGEDRNDGSGTEQQRALFITQVSPFYSMFVKRGLYEGR